MIGSPKPTAYESLMPPAVNPLLSTHQIPSTRPSDKRHCYLPMFDTLDFSTRPLSARLPALPCASAKVPLT